MSKPASEKQRELIEKLVKKCIADAQHFINTKSVFASADEAELVLEFGKRITLPDALTAHQASALIDALYGGTYNDMWRLMEGYDQENSAVQVFAEAVAFLKNPPTENEIDSEANTETVDSLPVTPDTRALDAYQLYKVSDSGIEARDEFGNVVHLAQATHEDVLRYVQYKIGMCDSTPTLYVRAEPHRDLSYRHIAFTATSLTRLQTFLKNAQPARFVPATLSFYQYY